MTTTTEGLEDIVATQSHICDLDGKLGKLTYFGVDIHDLALNSSFEETVYLLWHGALPTRAQLADVQGQLRANRALPGRIIDLLRLLPVTTPPMDVLRTVVSALSAFDPDLSDHSAAANYRRAVRLTAVLPTIVTSWEHIRHGRDPIVPRETGNHATNFLYLLTGREPDVYTAQALDVALILHADHELNASTFAARVTAGTLADVYASITAAVAALSGPLHGGANEQVIRTLLRIGDVHNVETYVDEALVRKERIMGFGHRVYRTEDPRATHLREMSRELGERAENTRWYEISRALEASVKARKGLNPNVDFYSASVYYVMGIPIELDTPLFACSRVAGWTAHVLEQLSNNRLIRPRADYVGPKTTVYVPLAQRG
jgi:citrate synthase